jgi:hypothetical protein
MLLLFDRLGIAASDLNPQGNPPVLNMLADSAVRLGAILPLSPRLAAIESAEKSPPRHPKSRGRNR